MALAKWYNIDFHTPQVMGYPFCSASQLVYTWNVSRDSNQHTSVILTSFPRVLRVSLFDYLKKFTSSRFAPAGSRHKP